MMVERKASIPEVHASWGEKVGAAVAQSSKPISASACALIDWGSKQMHLVSVLDTKQGTTGSSVVRPYGLSGLRVMYDI